EGGTLNIPSPGVLANDTDANGDSLTAILVSGPSHAASFSLQPSGGFSYTHDGSEAASDSFTYRASDGIASSNVTTVTIGIAPINDAPVANNDSYVVDQSGTLNTPSPGVLTNDTDADGDSLVAILLSGPSNAAFFALGPGGAFSYIHNGSATTGDSFTYRVSDGATFSNIATVSINITPVNQPPVANAGVDQVVSAGDAVTLNGSASSDPDGSLTAFQWSQTAGPSVALSDPSSPTPGLIAPGVAAQTILAFNLIVIDDAGARSNAATVTVTVNPLTVSTAGACYTTSSGQLLRGRLDDVMDKQGPLKFSLVSAGHKGTALVTDPATGAFTYMPTAVGASGSDTLTYKVQDHLGHSRLGQMTVVIDPKLMALGGAITAGVIDRARQLPVPEARVGYRKPLQQELAAAGYRMDFVGSQDYGAGVSGFDYQSEAHVGRTVRELALGSPAKDIAYPHVGIYAWLEQNPADFVLLQVGAQDIRVGGIAAVAALLDEIDRWEQDHHAQVRVLLAGIIEPKPIDPRIAAFNAQLARMAKARRRNPANPAYPDRITLVNPQGFVPADMHDRLHPNATGYAKLAGAWLKAMQATCKPPHE
ncbi:MAG TPA: Ig-like domain-containing protein, partial [Gammaproteobacteria bacterium]|nr:Ig-like domain-containing protein [Gammaproteobacteria bacterium]